MSDQVKLKRRCPECGEFFDRSGGFRHRQGYAPAVVIMTYCSTDCLLDARERRLGRDPRERWPSFAWEMWRGKRIHSHG